MTLLAAFRSTASNPTDDDRPVRSCSVSALLQVAQALEVPVVLNVVVVGGLVQERPVMPN
ncbi:hypothetical protein [Amycolatopsis sp. cg9]|uniref:hypothetical protein n=1 Tax=Amycolatopsis sp. cg9 TaxID=3238801 RepID=UPI0035267C63